MAAVLEIPLAVDLDILPGELLAQPAEAGLVGHGYGLLALGWLHLLLQEDVDAEGVDARVRHRRHVVGAQPRPHGAGRQVGQPLDLRQQRFLAGQVEEQRFSCALAGL